MNDPNRIRELTEMALAVYVPQRPNVATMIIMVDRSTSDIAWVSTMPQHEAMLYFAVVLQKILEKGTN